MEHDAMTYQPKMFINEPWYSPEPLPATSWLIKNLLPEGTPEYPYLTVIGGDPGSYKTTVLAAIFGSLTTGVSLLGRKAKQRETLLVAGEDPWGAKKRGQAVFINLDVSPEEVKTNFFNTPVNLYNSNEVKIAAEDIIGQGLTPKVLAFDTTFACSEGADLTKQIFMVHVLNNARRLCQRVGATNGILTHHNTKNSESLYGSVGLPATVDVIIICKDLGGDRVEITNERMKMDRKFPGFVVQLTPVKIKVLHNDEEDEGKPKVVEEEWLVVPNAAEAEAAKPKMKKSDKDLSNMLMVLNLWLGNRATAAEWEKGMADWMSKIGKKPWAESTFFEKRKILVEQGRVVGGGAQGEFYSVVRIQPETQPGTGEGVYPNHSESNNSDRSPLQGERSSRSGFGDSDELRKHSENENRSGSSQGSAGGQDSPPAAPSGEDLIAKATAHARAAPNPTVQAAADRAQARSDATKTKMK
jgi:hypothetical protein